MALLGYNGSDKTTLVKHFNGLLRPTKGAVCKVEDEVAFGPKNLKYGTERRTALVQQALAWVRQTGKTVLVISHEMDFVAEHFSHLLFLEKGEKRYDGSVRSAFRNLDLLHACGLLPPQMVRLSRYFQQEKCSLSAAEFVEQLCRTKKNRSAPEKSCNDLKFL